MKIESGESDWEKRENEQRNVWRTLVQVYREFASESSVHGIKYTTQAKTTIERLLWLIIVIISLVSAGQLANKFYDRHKSANMRTTVVTNQYPTLKLALPAVTLCQGNLVSTARLLPFQNMQKRLYLPGDLTLADFMQGLRYLREIVHPSRHYGDELAKLQSIMDANRMSIPQLLELVSPTCEDLLVACVFEGRARPCEELFMPMLTSYGICCSFNSALQKRSQLARNSTQNLHDLYTVNFGSRYILSVLLKPYNTSDQIASMTYGDGFKVLIHERYTQPGPNALDFMAGAAHETIVGLRGTYLISSPEVQKMPEKQRDCRSSTKKQLYRSENCYMKCRDKSILSLCGCVPFHAADLNRRDTLCNLTNRLCLARIISDIYSLSLRDPQCDCLPDCESTKYTIAITGEPLTAARFRPGKFFEKARRFPNSTALHITFAEQAAVLESRELVLSWINLVSSLGGVFSLFLGCSFISVIEFFYFFFFQLIKKLKSKYRRNSSVINSR